jgi:ABC-type lipoprotein release transport system permease subunit
VAERLQSRLPPADVAAVTWDQNLPELASFIAMKVGSTVFFELIIAILVAAGIFNTLFVSVMERLREFGIMMAIGFSPRRLFSLVMWESLWIGLVGLLAAGVVTALPYYLANTKGLDMSAMVGKGGAGEVAGVTFDPILYVEIYPESLGLITVAVLLATLLSGLYPAWRAGRVAPVESIKLV